MPNPENIEPFKWKPGQSGNPKGSKPKIMSRIIKELKLAGFEPVTRDQITDAFGLVMNMEEAEIKAMIADPSQPMLLRIVGRRMMSKDGHEMLEKMMDRAHGKAKQQIDHVSDGKALGPILSLNHLTIDDLRRLTEDSGNKGADPDGSQG